MRKDRAFKIRFKQYLKDMFSDIAKSDGGFYKYFHPDAKNKRNFAQKEYFTKNFTSVQRLFPNDPMAYYKMHALTNAIFGRMLKDFHDKYHRLYLPKKVGENKYEFTYEQDVVLTRLTDSLIEEADVKESEVAATPEREEQRLQTQKVQALKDLEQRLQKSGFIIQKEGLRINEETGLIEGQVQNKNGEILNLEFDPELQNKRNPGFIMFSEPNTGLKFLISNTEPSLYLAAKFGIDEMTKHEQEMPKKTEVQKTDSLSSNKEHNQGINKKVKVGTIAETDIKFDTGALLPSISQEETVQMRGSPRTNKRTTIKKHRNITHMAEPAAPTSSVATEEGEQSARHTRYTEEDLHRKEYLKQQMSQEEQEQAEQEEKQMQKKRQQKKKKGAGLAALITGGVATGVIGTAGYISILQQF